MNAALQVFLTIQAASLVISAAGFLIGGGALHWWFYVRQADRSDAWKLQPDRWLSTEQQRRALWLGLANTAMAALVGGCFSAWVALGGWSRLAFEPLAHGWVWPLVAFVLDVMILDFLIYWAHRWMHTPTMYRRYHSVHHRFRAPTAFTMTATHPLEIFTYVLLAMIPPLIVPQFFGVYVAVMVYTFVVGVVDHTGAKLRLPFPLHTHTRFHDDHHVFVRQNFGHHSSLWDRVFNTARLRPLELP